MKTLEEAPFICEPFPGSREAIGKSFQRRGQSDEAVKTLLSSLSENTVKQYNSSLEAWWNFCKTKHWDPYKLEAKTMLEFLQHELKTRKARYGTFNQHRSALSLISGKELGKDPLVRRFLRGIARLRPPRARYNCTWDPKILLNHITCLGDNEQLSLLRLSRKLSTLLALASGQRTQTLYSIEVDNIIFTEQGAVIKIPDLIKTSRPGAPQPYIELPFFHKSELCVAKTLLNYIEKTAQLRETSYLFVSSRDPHKRASRATISRWIKTEMGKAGIDVQVFSAHSTRHAVTSAASRAGVGWDTIRNAAGWSSGSQVFSRFYNRPLDQSISFMKAVFT